MISFDFFEPALAPILSRISQMDLKQMYARRCYI